MKRRFQETDDDDAAAKPASNHLSTEAATTPSNTAASRTSSDDDRMSGACHIGSTKTKNRSKMSQNLATSGESTRPIDFVTKRERKRLEKTKPKDMDNSVPSLLTTRERQRLEKKKRHDMDDSAPSPAASSPSINELAAPANDVPAIENAASPLSAEESRTAEDLLPPGAFRIRGVGADGLGAGSLVSTGSVLVGQELDAPPQKPMVVEAELAIDREEEILATKEENEALRRRVKVLEGTDPEQQQQQQQHVVDAKIVVATADDSNSSESSKHRKVLFVCILALLAAVGIALGINFGTKNKTKVPTIQPTEGPSPYPSVQATGNPSNNPTTSAPSDTPTSCPESCSRDNNAGNACACVPMASDIDCGSCNGWWACNGDLTVGKDSCNGLEACWTDAIIGSQSCNGRNACSTVTFASGFILVGDNSCNCDDCCNCLPGGVEVPDNSCNTREGIRDILLSGGDQGGPYNVCCSNDPSTTFAPTSSPTFGICGYCCCELQSTVSVCGSAGCSEEVCAELDCSEYPFP